MLKRKLLKLGLIGMSFLLQSCVGGPTLDSTRIEESEHGEQGKPSCHIATDRKVDSLLPTMEGQEQLPVSFGVSILSNGPAEFVELIAPLDSRFSPVQSKYSPAMRAILSFQTPGSKNVTAILKNPETLVRFRCSIELEVGQYELITQTIPEVVEKGELILIESHLSGSMGIVNYRAIAKGGEVTQWNPLKGEGSIMYYTAGPKIIELIAEDRIADETGKGQRNTVRSRHSLTVSDKAAEQTAN